MDEQQTRVDLPLLRGPVHRDANRVRRHCQRPPARSTAFVSARAVSTRAISRLYSTDPRRSADGDVACPASFAASAMVFASGFFFCRNFSASTARIAVGPAAVSAMPARSTVPSAASVSLRGRGRRREITDLAFELHVGAAAPAGGVGTRISVKISSGASAVEKIPVKSLSMGIVRSPWPGCRDLGAERDHRGRMIVGWIGMARLPPTVARFRTIGSAMTSAVSWRIGYFFLNDIRPFERRFLRSPADLEKPAFLLMYSSPGMRPMSTRWAAAPMRSLSSGRRLCPPESTLA